MSEGKKDVKWTRDSVGKHIVQQIAKNLPQGYLEQCIEEALQKCIGEFSVNSYEINGILKEVVLARTKEIIKTKYSAMVEAKAEELAQKAFAR